MSIIFQTCFTVILLCKVFTLGLKCTIENCDKNNDKQLLDIEGFIVGGNRTTIDQFPHAVFLSIEWMSYCGSSVLTQWILLTAAHCVSAIRGEFKIDAYAGHENLYKVTIIRQVTNFKIHERYEWPDNKEFDLAIMFLEEALPIGETPKVKRVIIRDVYPYKVKTAQVAGWGSTSDDEAGNLFYILKATNQKVLSADKCWKLGKVTKPGLMCARESLKNRPYYGDGGSGLITADYQQIGIFSFGLLGAAFYINVTHYYHWITQEAERNCKLRTEGLEVKLQGED